MLMGELALIVLSIRPVVVILCNILNIRLLKRGWTHASLTKAKGISFIASFQDRALNHNKHV